MALEHGLDLVIVDYLQLLVGSGRRYENRTQEVTEISRGLKMLAKELDIPVIAVSQLNREIENAPRKSRRPQLSDLRDQEQSSRMQTWCCLSRERRSEQPNGRRFRDRRDPDRQAARRVDGSFQLAFIKHTRSSPTCGRSASSRTFIRDDLMRIRQIKPEFYLDDELAEHCSRDARLLFPGLWMIADREGRLEDRPGKIKAQVFPYDDDIGIKEIVGLIDQLEHGGFVIRYEVAGRRLLWIRSFSKHQHCHTREQASQLPDPPKDTKKPGASPVQGNALPATGPVKDQQNSDLRSDTGSVKQTQTSEMGHLTEKPGASPSASTSTYGLRHTASGRLLSAAGTRGEKAPRLPENRGLR